MRASSLSQHHDERRSIKIGIFRKSREKTQPQIISTDRCEPYGDILPAAAEPFERELYDRLRYAVPVIDAAIMKVIRLTGGYRLISSDERYQELLDSFSSEVPVGLTGCSLGTFTDIFLDSLLTYGSAVGEIVPAADASGISGLINGDPAKVVPVAGSQPFDRQYSIKQPDGSFRKLPHPERIVYASLIGGHSILRGLPALSSILLRIYRCIGQNYDRAGNIRYAVTYKPEGETLSPAQSRERAMLIAREWSDGMNAAKWGQVKDFITVGDVDIRVIGSENQLFDTNVPVRQILEQLVAKLSIPPFLLGLNWSSTERMSSQQADILTSELEYYRRLLTPVIRSIGNAFLACQGIDAECTVEWVNINLQDEISLAEARLKNAQAAQIEKTLADN